MATVATAKYHITPSCSLIPNAAIKDPRLNFKHHGILLYVLSKPESWEFSTTDLMQRHGIGRDQVYCLVTDLIEAGYCRRERLSDGSFGYAFTWTSGVFG